MGRPPPLGLVPRGFMACRERVMSMFKGTFIHGPQGPKYRVGRFEVYKGRLVGFVVADKTEELVYVKDIRTAVHIADDLADEDYQGVLYTIKSRVKNYWQRAWWHDFKAWCDRMAIEKAMEGWR